MANLLGGRPAAPPPPYTADLNHAAAMTSVSRKPLPELPSEDSGTRVPEYSVLELEEDFDDYLEPDVDSGGSLRSIPPVGNPGLESDSGYGNDSIGEQATYEPPPYTQLLDHDDEYSELPDTDTDSNFYFDVASTNTVPILPPPRTSDANTFKRSASESTQPTARPLELNTMRIKEVRGQLRPSVTKVFEPVTSSNIDHDKGDEEGVKSVQAMRQRFEASSSSANITGRSKAEKANIYSPGSEIWQTSGKIKPAQPRVQPTTSKWPTVGTGLPRSVSQTTAPPVAAVTGETKSKPPPTLPKPSRHVTDTGAHVGTDDDLEHCSWFVGHASRLDCESRLQARSVEGAFLIRNSIRGDPCQPYTLCLFHDGTIFTLMVRRKANGKYAVGSEKNGETEFDSLVAMVNHHQRSPITVVGGQYNQHRRGNVRLTV